MRKRDWKRKGKNVLAAILSAAMVVNTALPEALVYASDTDDTAMLNETVYQEAVPESVSDESNPAAERSDENTADAEYEDIISEEGNDVTDSQNPDADITEDGNGDTDILADDADQAELYTAEDGTGEVVIDSADLVDEDKKEEKQPEEDAGDDMIAPQAADSSYVANDYMRYCRNSDTNIDIQGWYNNAWRYTTFSSRGYYLKESGLDNATVTIEQPSFVYGERFVEVTYKVTADKGAVSNGKLGVYADVQIGSNDSAAITLIRDQNGKAVGFQMIDDNRNYGSYNACFRLYFAGDVMRDNSPEADTYWMGAYYNRYDYCFNTVNTDSITGIDSGLALSWQNISLEEGESQTYKMLVGVGTEQDLNEALKSEIDCRSEAITGIGSGIYRVSYTENGVNYTYEFEVTDESGIPLKGTDKDGNVYDFIGKNISIGQVDATTGLTGLTKDLSIPSRPGGLKKEEIDLSETVLSQENKTITIAASEDQEYILVPEGTTVTPAMWENAQTGSSITFNKDSLGNELDTSKDYVIYTRIKATDSSLRSDSSEDSLKLSFHSHTWSYAVNGNVITATCAEATEEHQKTCHYCKHSGDTLTITANEQTYDGQPYHESTIEDHITELTGESARVSYVGREGTSYTEQQQAPVNAGKYTIKVQIGNVTASQDFIIDKRPVTISGGITAESKTYDGSADAALKYNAVQYTGLLSGDSLSITATGTFDSADAGENKTVRISDIQLSGESSANYKLAAEGHQAQTIADITKKEVTAVITPNGGIYGGTITPADVALNGVIDGETVAVSLIYSGAGYNDTATPALAGVYTVKASIAANANYTLRQEGSSAEFVIHKASPELTVSAVPEKTVGDADFGLTVGRKNDQNNVGTLSYTSSDPNVAVVDNAGNVTIKGAGTAVLTVSVTECANFEAESRDITITVRKADATDKLVVDTVLYQKTYGDPDFQIAATSTVEGTSGITYENKNPEIAEANAEGKVTIKNVGTAEINLNMAESQNYLAVSKKVTVEVVPKKITVSGITAASKVYDGTTTATLNYDHALFVGILSTDALSISGTGTFADKNAGQNKKVTISLDPENSLGGADAGKYVLAAEGHQSETTADITAKEITATITPNGGTYEGTITGATGTLNGLIGDDHPEITWTYSGRANDGTEVNGSETPSLAGTYRVTASINDTNYVLNPENASTEFVVNRTSPELSVSAIPDKNYNDDAFNLEITHKGNGQKTYESSDEQKAVVDADGKVTIKGAGNVTLTVHLAESANYTAASAQVTVRINQVENDKLVVEEIRYVKTYGDPSFRIAASMNGSTAGIHYESNDPTVASVDADGTVTVGNTGTASITVSMDESQNYFAVAKQVTVTVIAKEITISGITAEGKTYDGTTSAVLKYDGVQFTGKLEKDTLSVTAAGSFENKNAATGKRVRILDLELGNNEAGNYTLARDGQQTETFADITPKEITTVITPNGGTYEGIITPASATVRGVIGSEDPGMVLTYTGNANNGTSVNSTVVPTLAGTYLVTASLENTNYRLNSEGASVPFVIRRASPQLTVSATDMNYGENSTFKLDVGHKDGADGRKTYTSSNAAVAVISTDGMVTLTGGGQVTLKVELGESANYLADSKEVTITVNAVDATLTVEKINYQVTYGDAPFHIAATADPGVVLEYQSQYPAIASVNTNGDVTPLKVGETKITIRTRENQTFHTVSKDITVTVVKKKITISGIAADSKVYDGTAVAALKYDAVQYDGILPNDSLSITAAGTFKDQDDADDKNAGQNKRVAITGLRLGGSSVGNYELAPAEVQQTEAFADITPKPISAEITPNGGTYEGTITPATAVLKDVVDGDHPENGMSYVYTGTSNDGTETVNGADHPTKAGTYRVIVKITDTNYSLPEEAASADFIIDRAAADLKVDPVPEKKFGDQPFAITASSKGTGAKTFTYISSNEKVVKADQTGKVTIVGAGTANITVKVAQTANYKEDQKSVTITVKKIPHQLNPEKELYDNIVYGDQSVIVKATAGDQETGFRYATDNSAVATVDASGRITATGVGTAQISITLEESANYLAVTKKVSVSVIPKTVGITWGKTVFVYNGKVLAPTATATGLIGTDQCSVTVSGGKKTLGKHTAKAAGLSNPNYCLPSEGLTCSYQVRVISEQAERELALNEGLKVSQNGSKIRIIWGKVKGADGYNVYVQYCGKKFDEQSLHQVPDGNKTSLTIKKINGEKLSLTKNYKIYIKAYKNVEGKQVTLGRSITAHIVGRKNTTSTNVKGIKLQKSQFTLKKGKTATIKGTTIKVNTSRNQLSNAHAKELRYTTNDPTVATVSAKGKIKAVGKGKCTIYVYARNGYAKKVKVTVK